MQGNEVFNVREPGTKLLYWTLHGRASAKLRNEHVCKIFGCALSGVVGLPRDAYYIHVHCAR